VTKTVAIFFSPCKTSLKYFFAPIGCSRELFVAWSLRLVLCAQCPQNHWKNCAAFCVSGTSIAAQNQSLASFPRFTQCATSSTTCYLMPTAAVAGLSTSPQRSSQQQRSFTKLYRKNKSTDYEAYRCGKDQKISEGSLFRLRCETSSRTFWAFPTHFHSARGSLNLSPFIKNG
jgi:hypothetical protein